MEEYQSPHRPSAGHELPILIIDNNSVKSTEGPDVRRWCAVQGLRRPHIGRIMKFCVLKPKFKPYLQFIKWKRSIGPSPPSPPKQMNMIIPVSILTTKEIGDGWLQDERLYIQQRSQGGDRFITEVHQSLYSSHNSAGYRIRTDCNDRALYITLGAPCCSAKKRKPISASLTTHMIHLTLWSKISQWIWWRFLGVRTYDGSAKSQSCQKERLNIIGISLSPDSSYLYIDGLGDPPVHHTYVPSYKGTSGTGSRAVSTKELDEVLSRMDMGILARLMRSGIVPSRVAPRGRANYVKNDEYCNCLTQTKIRTCIFYTSSPVIHSEYTRHSCCTMTIEDPDDLEANLLMELTRARREIVRAKKSLADCMVHEHEVLVDLLKFKSERKLDKADIGLGCMRIVSSTTHFLIMLYTATGQNINIQLD
ncbi:hypothetical protein EV702DRAFT_1050282 [Suillus placidus]|uniref:Uncharacterized protein n=1 Tax=Suillus placidus TaxID=48579 RepID=A0A9P6ZIE0_9AGAM|nr:hypothetical protein EV702DRAFT_1050282 [Suillus placidus]